MRSTRVHTHRHTHTDTQVDYYNPPPTLGLINSKTKNASTHVVLIVIKTLATATMPKSPDMTGQDKKGPQKVTFTVTKPY